MMQKRDWIVGFIPGVIITSVGLLSWMGILPFELSRTILVWIASIGGLLLLYAGFVEITNSNIIGSVSALIAVIMLVLSAMPALYSIGWLGSWAEFKLIGDTIYKLILGIEGIFLVVATFAMEL